MNKTEIDFTSNLLDDSYIYSFRCPYCLGMLYLDTLYHIGDKKCYNCDTPIKIIVEADN